MCVMFNLYYYISLLYFVISLHYIDLLKILIHFSNFFKGNDCCIYSLKVIQIILESSNKIIINRK